MEKKENGSMKVQKGLERTGKIGSSWTQIRSEEQF